MSTKNIDHLCRICVNESHHFKNIKDRYALNLHLFDVINDLCQLDICPGDELPEYICLQCHSQLLGFHKFKQTSHEGRNALISIKTNKVNMKEEPPDDTTIGVIVETRSLDPTEEAAYSGQFTEAILPDDGNISCDEEPAYEDSVRNTLNNQFTEAILPDGGNVPCDEEPAKVNGVENTLENKVVIKCEPADANYETESAPHKTMEVGADGVRNEPQVFVKCESAEANYVIESTLETVGEGVSFHPQALLKIEQGSTGYLLNMEGVPSLPPNFQSTHFQSEGHWFGMGPMNNSSISTVLTAEEGGMPQRVAGRRRRGFDPSRDDPEKREAQLEARRQKARLRRQLETKGEQDRRRQRQRESQRRRLERENEEGRALRLQKLRWNKAAYIARETPGQRVDRLWKMRMSQSRRLARESKEKREERLLQLTLNQVERRERIRGSGAGCSDVRVSSEGIAPGEDDLAGQQEGDPAALETLDEPGTLKSTPKTSRRSSKGSPQYKEELLGVPAELLATVEEYLGPEGELKVSVARRRRLKLRIQKASSGSHPQEKAVAWVEVGDPVTGSDPAKEYEVNQSLPQVSEKDDPIPVGGGVNPVFETDNEIPEATRERSRSNSGSSPTQDAPIHEGDQLLGPGRALNGCGDAPGGTVEGSGLEEVPSDPKTRRSSEKSHPQYNEDLLGVTEEVLAQGQLTTKDTTYRKTRRSSFLEGCDERHLKRELPKRQASMLVNYAENSVDNEEDVDSSGSNETDQTYVQPDGIFSTYKLYKKSSRRSSRDRPPSKTPIVEGDEMASENFLLDTPANPAQANSVYDPVISSDDNELGKSLNSTPSMRFKEGTYVSVDVGKDEVEPNSDIRFHNRCLLDETGTRELTKANFTVEEAGAKHLSSPRASKASRGDSNMRKHKQEARMARKSNINPERLLETVVRGNLAQSKERSVDPSVPLLVGATCTRLLPLTEVKMLCSRSSPLSDVVTGEDVPQPPHPVQNLFTSLKDEVCSRHMQLSAVKRLKLGIPPEFSIPTHENTQKENSHMVQTFVQFPTEPEVTQNLVNDSGSSGNSVETLGGQETSRRASVENDGGNPGTISPPSSNQNISKQVRRPRLPHGLNLSLVSSWLDDEAEMDHLVSFRNDLASSSDDNSIRWGSNSGRRKQTFMLLTEGPGILAKDEVSCGRLVLKVPSPNKQGLCQEQLSAGEGRSHFVRGGYESGGLGLVLSPHEVGTQSCFGTEEEQGSPQPQNRHPIDGSRQLGIPVPGRANK